MGRRGPARNDNSAVKVKCALRKCRSKADVKNCGQDLQLSRDDIEESACRDLRGSCRVVRFCCQKHKQLGKKEQQKSCPGSGRAPLNQDQVVKLFNCLVGRGAPWCAVLVLIQLFAGDRADAIRRVTWSWFSNLEPSSMGTPKLKIPKANAKTVPREIAFYAPMAHLLWRWRDQTPLQAPGGQTWPSRGQPCGAEDPLFPGFDTTGQARTWDKPISERAYLAQLKAAAAQFCQERENMHGQGLTHCYAHVDLDRLGTHSMKKTAVTCMTESGISLGIISSITGTSIRILQSTYDIPTQGRQSRALHNTFAAIIPGCSAPSRSVCTSCQTPSDNPVHAFCPACGTRY